MYKYLCTKLWQATFIFIFVVELFPFQVKVANVVIICLRILFSKWPPIGFCACLCTFQWAQAHLKLWLRCRLDSPTTPLSHTTMVVSIQWDECEVKTCNKAHRCYDESPRWLCWCWKPLLCEEQLIPVLTQPELDNFYAFYILTSKRQACNDGR